MSNLFAIKIRIKNPWQKRMTWVMMGEEYSKRLIGSKIAMEDRVKELVECLDEEEKIFLSYEVSELMN